MSAAAFPASLLDDIRARLPLDRVIGQRVTLKRIGRAWRGRCPFHDGKSPSFSVWRDRYRCFSCGEHGDLFTYAQWSDGGGFVGAVRRCAADAGVDLPQHHRQYQDNPAEVARHAAERAARLAQYQRERDAKDAAERAAAIVDARDIWAQCQPIDGTLGERYLIETRGAPRPASGWAPCLRYHAARKMLVGAGADADGNVQFVHRIYLKTNGTNAVRVDGSKRKTTRGPMDGAAIRLPAIVDGDVLHAEGLETGLSAWLATGNPTLIYCGTVASRMIPQAGRNVVLRDDDAPGSPADRLLADAMVRWREAGIDFAVATPWPERRGDKSDFNDVLREQGLDAVRARIAHCRKEHYRNAPQPDAEPPPSVDPPFVDSPTLRPCAPPRALPTATLDQAYTYHARTMLDFYRATDAGVPGPQIQMGGQGGTGKTEVVARFSPEGIKLDQDNERPHRQIVLVPEHQVLGRQIVDRYRAKGVDVAPLLGRGDPFNPKQDDLCTQPDAVAEALKSDLDVLKSVCGTADGKHCPDFHGCKWHAMRARAATAPVIVGAHNHLFHALPKDIAKDIGRLVIEEEFTTHGVRIFNFTVDTFSAAPLDQWPCLHEGNPDAASTKRAVRLNEMLAQAFGQDGDLTPEQLRAVGLVAGDFAEAVQLNRRREVPTSQYPGMPLDEQARRRRARGDQRPDG